MSLSRVARWALAIGAFLVAVRMMLAGVADAIAFTSPDLALMLDGANARALTARASAKLAGPGASAQAARDDARAALRADVFASGAYRVLARAAEADDDSAHAGALWRIAARSARDGEAQSAMILRALKDGDADAVVQRFDILLRGQHPWVWRAIANAAAPLLADEAVAGALAATLARDPPWRRAVVIELIEKAPDQRFVSRIYDSLRNGASRPTDEEARVYLQRLVRDGRVMEAYVAFLARLPRERLGRLGYLYNARFQYSVTNLPFDWEISEPPGALAEIVGEGGRQVLRVTFFGSRTQFRHVSHLLALPPGTYRFSGMERADSLQNPVGLRWALRCVGEGGAELAATRPLRGDASWRPFAVAFTVPEGCPAQRLVLELPARVAMEQEASGGVAFADLAID